MFKYLCTILVLAFHTQMLYAIEPCDSIVQESFFKLEKNYNLTILDDMIENIECFSKHNVDSIFYFCLQDEYLDRNYYDAKIYFQKLYANRKKDKSIRILEIFCTYELGRYNEVLLLINEYNNIHKPYFPLQLLQSKIFQKKGEFLISNQQLISIKPRNKADSIKLKIHLANNYIELNEFHKSEKIFKALLSTQNNKSLYFNYANFKLKEQKYAVALENYQKYLELNSRSNNQFSILNHGRVYTNMMQCYGKLNNPRIISCKDSAYFYKYKYIEQRINPEYGAIHQNLAEYYLLNEDYSKARMHIDSSIFHHLHYLSENPLDDLYTNEINTKLIHDKIGLLEYLYIKFKISKNTEDKDQIDQLFNIMDNLIQGIKKENYGIQSKLFSQDKLSKYYQAAFSYYINRNQLDQALQFSQKLKGTILLESINHSEATDVLIPEHRNQYLNLRYERNKLISELIAHPAKDSLTNLLSKNLLYQKELETSIRLKTPEFFNHLYTNESFETRHIQKTLKANEMMLDYIILHDTIYQLRISKHSLNSAKNAFNKDVLDEVKSIKLFISQPPDMYSWSFKEEKKLRKQLANLSDKLLFPMHNNFDQFILITHDELKNFPFCILTDSTDHHNYIVKNKGIYYAPNIALWLKNQQKETNIDQILIVDPFSQNIHSKNYLPSANIEAEQISKHFKSRRVETTSLAQIKEYSMAHLLTHAIINSERPMKSFLSLKGDSTSLTLENITHTRLNNDLVFISSCSSNAGLLSKNEGIISITRSFLEAGTRSVMATYWSIDDYASSQIVSHFYSNLHEGNDITSSIQNAQKQYLSNSGYYESHPFFWAAFHPNGINLKNDSNHGFKLWIGLIFLLPIGYFLYRYRLNHSA